MSLLALVVYVLTLSPTVNFIDSGEFIAVGALAGIAHPPGYPLYTLLTIAGAALPLGDPAVGVNLVSAAGGAAAAGFFFALMYELLSHYVRPMEPADRTLRGRPWSQGAHTPPATRRTLRATVAVRPGAPETADRTVQARAAVDWYVLGASAGAALLLCASFTVWSWSTQAKVYSLHFAFAAALFWLALRARRSVRGAGAPGRFWPPRHPKAWPQPARWLVMLAFGLGLALTNHTLAFMVVPSLAIILLWPQSDGKSDESPAGRQRGGRNVQDSKRSAQVTDDKPLWRWLLAFLPLALLAGLIPLLLYLYLPLRSAQEPLLNWGTPSTWGDFWRHVTLWQSRVLVGRQPPGGLAGYIARTTDMAVGQFGPWLSFPILIFAIVGAARLARNALPLLISMLLLVVITLVQTYNFQNAEIAAYFEHLYMMFIISAGVGLVVSLWALRTWIAHYGGHRAQDDGQKIRGPVWPAAIPIGLAVLALVWNAGRAGHANDHLADAYVHNHFRSFAPNAVVITNNWYLVSPSYYLQLVRHERPDVAVIDRKLLQYPFYLDYVTRQYPQVMATVKDLAVPFGDIARRWVDGEQVDSQQLSRLYFDMVHALITRNMDAHRPVYFQWHDPGPEETFIAQGLSTHPEGLSLRVDAQPFTGPPPDPHFDWRGVLTDVSPKDEIAHLVIDDYPPALDRLAQFARQTNYAAEAARYAAQAAQVRAALGLPNP